MREVADAPSHRKFTRVAFKPIAYHDAQSILTTLPMEISQGYGSPSNLIFLSSCYPQNNVLVGGDGHPLLCNFGLSSVWDDPDSAICQTSSTVKFNLRWTASEIILSNSRPTKYTDVYSLGSAMLQVYPNCHLKVKFILSECTYVLAAGNICYNLTECSEQQFDCG
jgi:serine/threonine protein kinase